MLRKVTVVTKIAYSREEKKKKELDYTADAHREGEKFLISLEIDINPFKLNRTICLPLCNVVVPLLYLKHVILHVFNGTRNLEIINHDIFIVH